MSLLLGDSFYFFIFKVLYCEKKHEKLYLFIFYNYYNF